MTQSWPGLSHEKLESGNEWHTKAFPLGTRRGWLQSHLGVTAADLLLAAEGLTKSYRPTRFSVLPVSFRVQAPALPEAYLFPSSSHGPSSSHLGWLAGGHIHIPPTTSTRPQLKIDFLDIRRSI